MGAKRIVAGVLILWAASCGMARADYGTATDAREVRDALLRTWTAFGTDPSAVAKAVTVPDVTIAGGYALCTFRAGAIGGQMLLQNRRGLWVKLFQTGGIMSSIDLRQLMPSETASALATHNAETNENDAFLLGRR